MYCQVHGCNSIEDGTREFFSFPQSKSCRDKWIQFCNKTIYDFEYKQAFICSLHFEETAYITEIKQVDKGTLLIRQLNSNAIPTLHQHLTRPKNTAIQVSNPNDNKYEHIKARTDLHSMNASNVILKKKIKMMEGKIQALKTQLSQQNRILAKLEAYPLTVKPTKTANSVLAKVFSTAQIKLLSGKMAHWTEDDIAIGCTIRYLSNRRFYSYLTDHLNFPLPGAATLRRKMYKLRMEALNKNVK